MITGNQLSEEVADAYFREAELLDAQDVASWAQWLHDDFRYELPVPVFDADMRAPRHSETGLLAVETRQSVTLWQQRLGADLIDSAYAENPPARTRHFVTNVRVREHTHDARIAVTSNVLLVWNDWNRPPQLISGERHDVLARSADGLLLVHRRVLLDSAVVRIGHLRVIL